MWKQFLINYHRFYAYANAFFSEGLDILIIRIVTGGRMLPPDN
jgi:hypothetical protein